MKKIIIFLFAVFIFLINFNIKPSKADSLFCQNAKSAVLISTTNNTILYQKNSEEKLPIASMTKVMTLSIIYDAIKGGKIALDDTLTTSEHAKSMGGSQVYLEVGEQHTLKDLIKCICIASANDAAVTVAEAISGSENAFVAEMNKKASELNMINTHYEDVTGLTDENHYSSATDMAIISSYLLTKHPEVLEYTSMKEGYFRENSSNPFWLVNTNKLIGNSNIDGLKTGWTNKAGYCISLTKAENDMRLVAVVMGYSSPILRNNEAKELINYGAKNFMIKSFLKQGDMITERKSVLYENGKFEYIADKNIDIIINKNDEKDYCLVYNYNEKNPNNGYVEVHFKEEVIDKTSISVKQGKKRNIIRIIWQIFNDFIC